MAHARRSGYSPYGCDLSKTICCRVEKSVGVPMHAGSIHTLPSRQIFDIVVMNHVLEHDSDPLGFLKRVRSCLDRDGMLHLAVPNVAAWEARLSGWNSYELYHLLYFTPQTLRLAVEKSSFTIEYLGTHESFSGWFLAILRTLLKKNDLKNIAQAEHGNNRPNLLTEHAYRLLMSIWGVCSFPLRILRGWLGQGDEIVIVARVNGDA